MRVRTTAIELSTWFAREGGQWTIDGDSGLGALPIPCAGAVLAEALGRRGSAVLELFAPDDRQLAEHAIIAGRDLGQTVHDVEGHRVLQISWVTPEGAVRDAWLVAEYVVTSARTPASGASAVIATFRAGYGEKTPVIRRKAR